MSKFSDQVNRRVNPKIDALMRGLLLDLTERVVDGTPVDTGRARANWNVSINRPDTKTFSVKDTRTQEQKEAKQLVPKYVAKARRNEQRNSSRAERWNAHKGGPAYLANGLPYISRLEQGYSTQRPQGWVRIAINDLRPQVRKTAAKIRRLQRI